MRYVKAKAAMQTKESAYRIYVTDGIKVLTENTSRQFGGQRFTRRFADILNPQPEDTRSAEKIIESIRSKIDSLEG